jgi:tRNA modification GTPase
VAVLVVAGPQCESAIDQHFHAKNRQPVASQPVNRILYGRWGGSQGEDIILCRQSVGQCEIHCHGGTQSAAALIGSLTAAGCQEITWQQWNATQQRNLLAAEALEALSRASTLRTAAILLEQYQGTLEREVDAIRALLAEIQSDKAAARLQTLLDWLPLGLHLTQPWQVVIVGSPNVGKSSLINALLGFQRAIVFDLPGTTRDVVSALTAIDGWPVVLCDTAGLHQTEDPLEAAGIDLARRTLANADLAVWVVDATGEPSRTNLVWQQEIARRSADLAVTLPTRWIMVVNKVDCIQQPGLWPQALSAVSARTGEGIAQLVTTIGTTLIGTAPPRGTALPFTPRQGELIQAAKVACLRGELHQADRHLSQFFH